MSDIPVMTPEQLVQARKLITKKCCNYDNGNCLALDGDEPGQCIQMWSFSLICKWFHFAVLPNDWGLCCAVHDNAVQKQCVICGRPIFTAFNRTKYCFRCSERVRKEKEQDRLHRRYERRRKSRI